MYGHPVTPPKSRWKSKTYWVNALLLVLFALEANLHLLQPLLAVNVFQLAAFVIPFVNFILREFTNRGVGALPAPGSAKAVDPHG